VALSPEDIVNHEFKQALRGYAVQEVDDLLDRLADQLERAERDIAELRQRVTDADARATEALATESSLKRTLITAQDAAQRTIDAATSDAEKLRSDADREATQQLEEALARSTAMIEEAETEASTIRASFRSEQEAAAGRVAGLATIEDRYRAQLRSLLEHQLGQLELVEATGSPGGPEVEALRETLNGVGPEAGEDGGSDQDTHARVDGFQGSDDLDGDDGDADSDVEEFVPFGGLTVREQDEDGDRSGRDDHDAHDGPDRDRSA